MTNHKCGTCRFYEVGAQKTHGWCRNPAYPRRDDVALLRNDELACRSGWGKDFWVAGDTASGIALPKNPMSDETTQPIPVPIGTGIAEHQTPAIVVAARMPAATGMPSRQATRQNGVPGATNTVGVPARMPTTAPKDGTMGTTKTSSPLSNHPELNELGVPIRAPKRTSVAEAHRRAMERRATERQTKEERDRLAAQEAIKEADALREQQLQVTIAEPKPTQRPIVGGLKEFGLPSQGSGSAAGDSMQQIERTTPKHELARPDHNGPKHELARPDQGGPKRELTQPTISTPIMPRKREDAVPQVAAIARDEAEDVIISTGEAFKETVKASLSAATLNTVGTVDTPTAQPGTTDFRKLDAAPQVEATIQPLPEPAPPIKEARPAPYWDQASILRGLSRFHSEGRQVPVPGRGNEGQPVRKVGRRDEVEPKPTPTRSIKPLGASMNMAQEFAEEREIAPPVRPVKPPVEVKQAIVAPPAAPHEPTPRQIDESLLRQLENDWRVEQRAAHSDQSCDTCRFFQAAELGRGACNCPFAPVYHQQTEGAALPCATALGVWWAAPDEGWLERTERRPRRATPLLDALLREREAMEPLRATPPLRRGAR